MWAFAGVERRGCGSDARGRVQLAAQHSTGWHLGRVQHGPVDAISVAAAGVCAGAGAVVAVVAGAPASATACAEATRRLSAGKKKLVPVRPVAAAWHTRHRHNPDTETHLHL